LLSSPELTPTPEATLLSPFLGSTQKRVIIEHITGNRGNMSDWGAHLINYIEILLYPESQKVPERASAKKPEKTV
jgi:hypothetical protein